MTNGATYRDSGVDIDAGEDAVEAIRPHVARTVRPGVVGGIGGFGGMFDLAATGYADPLLVASTDGVGTKALVATMADRYETIGIDLVAMCIDDLVCQGAEPLFFLDYVSVGALRPGHVEALVKGIADGCERAGAALIGGEIAEHPGMMDEGEFELVGFAIGAVERHSVITGQRVEIGDVLVGLHSPNLRSNGFSLARKILFDIAGRSLDDPAWRGANINVEDALLDPSVIYAPAVLAAAAETDVRAVAHITGGGLPGNVVRVLPSTADAVIDTTTWAPPPIFAELARLGGVADDEMFRVFNMGIGMVLVVPVEDAARAVEVAGEHGHGATMIGEVVSGSAQVRLG